VFVLDVVDGLVHHQAPIMIATTSTPARMMRKTKPTTRFKMMKTTTAITIPLTLERAKGKFIRQWTVGRRQLAVEAAFVFAANCPLRTAYFFL